MATTMSTMRMFQIGLSPDDGLVRIRRADTGRVMLALHVEEASQMRSALKAALLPGGKKRSKKGSKGKKKMG